MFRGGEGTDTLDLGTDVDGHTVDLNDLADDGPGLGGTADIGSDHLEGRGGGDVLRGDAGDDLILAVDRVVVQISCGDGNDAVFADWNDVLAAGCERITRIRDEDGDGTAAGSDCDDADPARFAGAAEVPANGVDENCDGVDGSFPVVAATIASGWKVFARYTQLTALEVKGAPARAKVRVTLCLPRAPRSRPPAADRRGGLYSAIAMRL